MSFGFGSSTAASIWVARKTRFVPSSANSSARTDVGLPITTGIIMWGKTTTSRIGIMGSLSIVFWITSSFAIPRLFRPRRSSSSQGAGHSLSDANLRHWFQLRLQVVTGPLTGFFQEGEGDVLVLHH